MSQPFCKLFETVEYGQILVMLAESEDGRPELKVAVRPDGCWASAVAMTFPGTDRGYDLAEQALDRMDEATAIKSVLPIFEALTEEPG